MRRIGGLYDGVWEWSNLRRAAHRAFRASRQGAGAREYFSNLDEHLRSLQKALVEGDVKLCPYREFLIHDPKERLISAPAFADRVLHHAVMGVCEPLFDRWSIADSYACRRGRGRLAALERATEFSRRFPWFFRGDIRKYFPSIRHPLLKMMIRRRFKDKKLITLFDLIVDSFGFHEKKGLPIGSLCSQHLANLFLDPFDRWVKEVARFPGYVRYMDDFVIFSDNPKGVVDCQRLVGAVLSSKLGLELKGNAHFNRSGHGFDFLGFRIFPGWRILNRRSRRRFRARFDELERRYQRGLMGEMELQQRVGSLLAFTQEGCSWKFRTAVLSRAINA